MFFAFSNINLEPFIIYSINIYKKIQILVSAVLLVQ